MYYKRHKVNFRRGGSYIDSPGWIKKTTIKPKNKEDNCFQYAVTIALNFEEIRTINFSWAASMLTHSLHTNIPLEETINICTNLLVAGYSRIVIHIQFSV